MVEETALAKITEAERLLSTITEIGDARKFLSIARGLVTTAAKEYKAAETINDSIEERDNAYETAVKAGELRLNAESTLGELIRIEQESGRLGKSSTDGTLYLKDYGLTKQDSSRAKNIFEHRDLISKAVEQARRSKDIPTRKGLELMIRTIPKYPAPFSPVPQIEPDDNQYIYTGDYTILYDKLDDNSVDLFFTDPPYDKKSLYLFEGLAELAQAKLKPGGLCLAYSGQSHLNEVIRLMSVHLDYWWVFSIFITGNELRIWSKKLWVRWKPVIVFSKRPTNGRVTDTWFCDYVQGSGQDKRFHKWGQSVQEATYWIEALVPETGLVADPFCGAGTIPLACKLTKRRWLATEKNEDIAITARKRLQGG